MTSGASLFGDDLFGNVLHQKSSGKLTELYIVPPFSLLDARSGYWQERNAAWKSLGIKSELGRTARAYNMQNNIGGGRTDTSVFDPTLCEIAYRWFCPRGGQIVDPFAGGSVRGIVAGFSGFKYHGIDLRQDQIKENRKQKTEIIPTEDVNWVIGDSMEKLDEAPCSDFIFTCPPYGDLEKYSKNPSDLSNMDHHAFVAAYKRIILRCYKNLKPDSFAGIVVGDFRCKKGYYRNFVSDTINAFLECGFNLYNHAIIVKDATASLRVNGQFPNNRKLVKIHQDFLVFCKGDWKKASGKINENQEAWNIGGEA